jgi:uncharacterized protein (DUF305 family)
MRGFYVMLLFVVAAFCIPMRLASSPLDAPFMTQVFAAMSNMAMGMDIKPSGNVDEDFVAAMVPHHQGAIEMAKAELRYGRNSQLQRIAQEIIITQQEEITAMRFAVGTRPASLPSRDQTPRPKRGPS